MALAPGVRLGPYEIAAQIGVGGMGKVYRATDTKLDREVAIKVLPESLAEDPEPVNGRLIGGEARCAAPFSRGRNLHLTKWRQCRHWVESVLRPRGSWYELSPPMRASRSKY